MYKLNQIVFTKKPHVCGSNQWIIKRVGVDIKLECSGCGRVIMLSSFDLDKRLKTTLSKKELEILKNHQKEEENSQN